MVFLGEYRSQWFTGSLCYSIVGIMINQTISSSHYHHHHQQQQQTQRRHSEFRTDYNQVILVTTSNTNGMGSFVWFCYYEVLGFPTPSFNNKLLHAPLVGYQLFVNAANNSESLSFSIIFVMISSRITVHIIRIRLLFGWIIDYC